jgi:oxygen-independent coproporphyrinogen-3 oxidase
VVEKYIKHLKCELEILSDIPFLNNVRLANLHIGGGTPTFLDNKHIVDLMSFIRYHFEIANDAEITWESSPETIIREHAAKLETLLENGVNRLNIGIQAFEDHLLRICNRRHSAADAEQSIKNARKAGFTNINIDLIYGLPNQTIEDWQHTLDKVAELLPESVTIYHLRCHPDSKFADFSIEKFPPENTCLLMQIYGYEKLKNIGYTQIQPCQFVLSSKYNNRYVIDKWGKGTEFLGVGVSAYGYINDYIYVNHRRLKFYNDTVASKKLPVCLGKRLSLEQKMAKAVILGLKVLPSGVNPKDFKEKFGITINEVFGKVLTRLEKLGLVEITPASIRLTPIGVLFADEVCTVFYTKEEKLKLKKIKANKYGCYLRY